MSPMAATATMSLSGSIIPSRMSVARTLSIFFSGLSFLTLSSLASADCVVEREPAGESQLFIRHFASGCSKLDREARAVGVGEILGALRAGKGVSLMNAVIKADLLLTQQRFQDIFLPSSFQKH